MHDFGAYLDFSLRIARPHIHKDRFHIQGQRIHAEIRVRVPKPDRACKLAYAWLCKDHVPLHRVIDESRIVQVGRHVRVDEDRFWVLSPCEDLQGATGIEGNLNGTVLGGEKESLVCRRGWETFIAVKCVANGSGQSSDGRPRTGDLHLGNWIRIDIRSNIKDLDRQTSC